jgi:hypothetical protein
MYHYFTTVGSRELAANADSLRNRRDRNENGLPIVYDACWEHGIETFGFWREFEYSLALTKSTMSSPMAYDNDGGQLIARLGVRPAVGLRLGVSAEYGSYLGSNPIGLPQGRKTESVHQQATAFDLHYSIAHTSLFAEWVRAAYQNPNLSKDLACISWYTEIKQVLVPGLYASARLDRMTFDEFVDSGGESFTWDDNITRLEAGLGYYFNKDTLLKLVLQHNRIDNRDDVNLLSTQLIITL